MTAARQVAFLLLIYGRVSSEKLALGGVFGWGFVWNERVTRQKYFCWRRDCQNGRRRENDVRSEQGLRPREAPAQLGRVGKRDSRSAGRFPNSEFPGNGSYCCGGHFAWPQTWDVHPADCGRGPSQMNARQSRPRGPINPRN